MYIAVTARELNKQFQIIYTLKTALAATLTAIIVHHLNLKYSYFAVLTTLVIMLLFHDELITKGLERIIGATVAALLALGMISILLPIPWLYALTSFIIILSFMTLFASGKFAYASMLGGMTFAFLAALAFIFTANHALLLATDWLLGITIGVVIAWLADKLILPHPPQKRLLHAFAQLLQNCQRALDTSFEQLLEHIGTNKTITILTPLENISTLIQLTKRSRSARWLPFNELDKLAALMRSLSLQIKTLQSYCNPLTSSLREVFFQDLLSLNASFNKQFDYLLRLASGEKAGSNFNHYIKEALKHIELHYQTLREQHKTSNEPVKALLLLMGLMEQLSEIQQTLQTIEETLTQIASHKKGKIRNTYREIFAATIKSLLEDTPFSVAIKQGLAITSSIFIVIAINKLLGWNNITMQAIITATIITAQSNLGRSYHRARLRVYGIAAGISYSALCLLLLILKPNEVLLFLLIAVGFIAFCYVALSGEKYGYAGIQAALIIPLTLLVGKGDVGSLTIAIQRVGGVFEGAIVGLLLLHFLWPIDPIKQIRIQLSKTFTYITTLFDRIITVREQTNRLQIDELKHHIERLLVTNLQLIEDAKHVFFDDKTKIEQVHTLINMIDDLSIQLETIEEHLQKNRHSKLINQFLHDISKPIIHIKQFFNIMNIYLNNPLQGPPPRLTSDINRLSDVINHYHEQKTTLQYQLSSVETFALLVLMFQQVLLISGEIREIALDFAE